MTLKKFTELLKTYWLLGTVLLVWLLIFLPYLHSGTFYIDDWPFVNTTHQSGINLLNNFHANFQQLAYRPMLLLAIPLVSTVLFSNFLLIALLNLAIYTAGIMIAVKSIYLLLGEKTSLARYPGPILLFFLPVISTTFVFSPLTHLATTLAVFFWALSLRYTVKATINPKSNKNLLLVALFIILALFSYEIFLPLLSLNIVAFLYGSKRHKKTSIKIALRKLLLIVTLIFISLCLVLFYQKKIAVGVFHNPDNSKFHSFSLDYLIRRYIEDWFRLLWEIRFDLKTIVVQSAHIAYHHPLFIFNGIAATAVTSLATYKLSLQLRAKQAISMKRAWPWGVAFLMGIISSILLITISLYPLTVGGYLNRMLFPLWFIFSFIFMIACRYFRPRYLVPLIALIVFMCSIVFQAQLNKFDEGSAVRMSIKKDLSNKLSSVPDGVHTILGDVPRCVPYTLMNDDIFSEQWDFGGVAEMASKNKISKASVIQKWNFDTPSVYALTDNSLTLFNWFSVTPKDLPLLFYQYDLSSKQSHLIRINTFDQLKVVVTNMRATVHDNCKNMATYPPKIDIIDAHLRKIFKDN